MKLTVTLTGIVPMLQHNGRLVNPVDPHTQALKALTAKRKKTDEDNIDIMQVEARGACYETTDGYIAMPDACVWRSIKDGATGFKRGKDIERALISDHTTVPLIIDGRHHTCEEWLSTPDHIDYRAVKVGMSRVMRSRPFIPAGWQSTHSFELLEDVIDPRDMLPILERAGRLVGVGDYRPSHGRYNVTID